MERKNFFQSECSGRLYLTTFLFALLLMLPSVPRSQGAENYTVSLASRQFVPVEGIDSGFASNLQTQFFDSAKAPYVIVQLKRNPTRQQRETLKRDGIELLSSIGGNAWYTSITDSKALQFTNAVLTRFYPGLRDVRWIGGVQPDDRIQPFLRTVGPGEWARQLKGLKKFRVRLTA